ncbi:MAG: aspartate-semialdehyde dehydrogenase [Cellvibrionaceae bacterium]|jgi:aspartate-semialdehyde dehydrogenase
MKSIKLALVGATGAVGEVIIELLGKQELAIEQLYLLASQRTAGTSLMFRSRPVVVRELSDFDFAQVDLVIFVANSEVSSSTLSAAQSKGCLVIDNSQVFAESAPLIVPFVNGHLLAAKPKLVVNPDSNAIQLTTLLKPFMDSVGIKRVNVTALQSVSSHGKKALHELASQTASLLNGRGAKAEVYPKQIAFNLLPSIGDIADDGHSDTEQRLVQQTRRILGDETLNINAVCIQAPIFYVDCMAVTFDTIEPLTLDNARQILEKNSEIRILDYIDKNKMATPVTHGTGSESIIVSRLRQDMSHDNGINLWMMIDSVKKSAAINTIQITRELIKSH